MSKEKKTILRERRQKWTKIIQKVRETTKAKIYIRRNGNKKED